MGLQLLTLLLAPFEGERNANGPSFVLSVLSG